MTRAEARRGRSGKDGAGRPTAPEPGYYNSTPPYPEMLETVRKLARIESEHPDLNDDGDAWIYSQLTTAELRATFKRIEKSEKLLWAEFHKRNELPEPPNIPAIEQRHAEHRAHRVYRRRMETLLNLRTRAASLWAAITGRRATAESLRRRAIVDELDAIIRAHTPRGLKISWKNPPPVEPYLEQSERMRKFAAKNSEPVPDTRLEEIAKLLDAMQAADDGKGGAPAAERKTTR